MSGFAFTLATHLPVSAIAQKALLRRIGAREDGIEGLFRYPFCIPLIRNAKARWTFAFSRSKNITNFLKGYVRDAASLSQSR